MDVADAPLIALLFVPADRPDRFEKAATSGADAIIVDLEDAVAPEAKEEARGNLRSGLPDAVPVFVRINARETPWHEEDLIAAADSPCTGIMLAKAGSLADIDAVRAALGAEREIIALIETAEGLANARHIAAEPGVSRLAFGHLDYAADLGCGVTREALLTARSEIVLAARLAGGAPPWDGVTQAIDDADATEDDARYAAMLGFGGKMAIHPKQIAPIRAGFAPTAEDVAWAEKVVAAPESGAVTAEGTFIDAPIRKRAEAILAHAAHCRHDSE